MERRHVITTVTMLILIGIVVLGAVLGWRALFAELPEDSVSTEEPVPSCIPETIGPNEKVRSSQVRVSVFNGGTKSGLAGETLDALARRGFVEGDVGNAPADVNVRVVQVWSTEENDPRARLVARQFGRNVKVRFSDEDLGVGVDVVVGDRFEQLVKAPRSFRVKKPREVCVPNPAFETEDVG
jgi:hypothetical protein